MAMGIPVKMKTYKIKSKIGDSLEVRIEQIGGGENVDILYRIIRGSDRQIVESDRLVLFKEELEQLSEFLKEDFLNKEFSE